MCMSVPQMAVLAISISTSLGPTFGSGTSSNQMPGAASFFTNAFISWPAANLPRGSRKRDPDRVAARDAPNRLPSLYYPKLFAYSRKRFDSAIQLVAGQRGRHLGADARLSLGDHGE